jgi:predicted DNA-binding protein (MmcQ/YjbR family)
MAAVGNGILAMTFPALKRFLLSLSSVETNVQWGDDHVFRIGGKIFAVAGDNSVSFKVDPENFLRWLEAPGVEPAPYLSRAQWVCVRELSALPRPDLEDGLRRSYELIRDKLPKKVQDNFKPTSETTRRATKSRQAPIGSA